MTAPARPPRYSSSLGIILLLCADVWSDYSFSLSVFFCLSAVMTPQRDRRTVTPCRRWPSRWQNIHRVHPAMNCITLRANKAFFFITSPTTMCLWVWVCVWLWAWWATVHAWANRGNLKYIIAPIFQLHNTIKVHALPPKAKQRACIRLEEVTPEEANVHFDDRRKQQLRQDYHYCCSHSVCTMSYHRPMEDMTKTELLSLPRDTPPHTFYNHSLFLDEMLLLWVSYLRMKRMKIISLGRCKLCTCFLQPVWSSFVYCSLPWAVLPTLAVNCVYCRTWQWNRRGSCPLVGLADSLCEHPGTFRV